MQKFFIHSPISAEQLDDPSGIVELVILENCISRTVTISHLRRQSQHIWHGIWGVEKVTIDLTYSTLEIGS